MIEDGFYISEGGICLEAGEPIHDEMKLDDGRIAKWCPMCMFWEVVGFKVWLPKGKWELSLPAGVES